MGLQSGWDFHILDDKNVSPLKKMYIKKNGTSERPLSVQVLAKLGLDLVQLGH